MSVTLAAALVAAAISLKAPLEEAAQRFGATNPGDAITFTFGGSGQLATQIEQGAAVDLFVAASPVDVERLVVSRRIELASIAVVAGNRLVVVVPHTSSPPADLAALADLAAPRFARIAIGNPKTVPAGRYAREVLLAAGVLDGIEKRLVYVENVRQVADLVAHGEVDAGFVYATDVPLGGAAIARALEIPERLHTPILYEGAVVTGSSSAARAREFLKFLTSTAGRDIFVRHGFLPPRTPATK